MLKIYCECMSENNLVSVFVSEERNKNGLKIHNNNIGLTTYENTEIWDSDVLKIIRVLDDNKYKHYKSFNDIVKDMEKETRHLKINNKSNEI